MTRDEVVEDYLAGLASRRDEIARDYREGYSSEECAAKESAERAKLAASCARDLAAAGDADPMATLANAEAAAKSRSQRVLAAMAGTRPGPTDALRTMQRVPGARYGRH